LKVGGREGGGRYFPAQKSEGKKIVWKWSLNKKKTHTGGDEKRGTGKEHARGNDWKIYVKE